MSVEDNKVYLILDVNQETDHISTHSIKWDIEEAKRIADNREALVVELPIIYDGMYDGKEQKDNA